jgi:carbamoyl-phosphate synthase large subunit
MAGLAAIVQGIEAIMRNEVGVRSLQQHAATIRGVRGSDDPGPERS